jgi:hypothetical protein
MEETDGIYATPEDVAYALPYYGDDDALMRVIVDALMMLPCEVRAFALEHCCFLSIGRANLGMVLPGRIATDPVRRRTRGRWFVLLAEDLPEGDAHGIVAHEVAHAWLGHDRLSPECPQDCEEQTAGLTRDWGFSGKGADAAHCGDLGSPSAACFHL